MYRVNNFCPTEWLAFETLIVPTLYPEFVCEVNALRSYTSLNSNLMLAHAVSAHAYWEFVYAQNDISAANWLPA